MKNTIFKKQIILQLEKGPSARHLIFDIELRHTQSARNFETLEEIADPVELSICGATHLRGCSCQMRERILTFKNRVKENDKKTFNFICDIWEKYHLNTFKAGTKAQEEKLTEQNAQNCDYSIQCNILNAADLLVDRGYRYGSDWLCEPIPAEIIAQIKEIR